MGRLQSFITFIALSCSLGRLAAGAIGPVADLTISDADISPDGYTRAAVVVNGQFPGPIISGTKVKVSAENAARTFTHVNM